MMDEDYDKLGDVVRVWKGRADALGHDVTRPGVLRELVRREHKALGLDAVEPLHLPDKTAAPSVPFDLDPKAPPRAE